MGKKIGKPKKKKPAVERIPGQLGRPLEYRPEHCQTIIEIAKKGGFVAKMCQELGIHHGTFYKWKEKYPEFAEAHEMAKVHQKAYLEKIATGQAEGEIKGSFQAAKLLLVTKFKDEYFDDTAKSNVSYHIGQMTNNFSAMSQQELDDRINLLLQKQGLPALEHQDVLEGEFSEISNGT